VRCVSNPVWPHVLHGCCVPCGDADTCVPSAVDLSNFAPVPVKDPQEKPLSLKVNVEASARVAVTPSVYLGIVFENEDDDGFIQKAKAYAKATPRFEAQVDFKLQTAINPLEAWNATTPLPALTSSYCDEALFGCAAACLREHDTQLEAKVEFNMTAGYLFHTAIKVMSIEKDFGSAELKLFDTSFLSWNKSLGAWCQYLFPLVPVLEDYYRVGFEGGLKIGGDWGPPVLGVRGRIVSDGVSWLELATVEEWRPLGDMLPMPKLNGTARFYPDGSVDITATASLSRSVVIPSLLELRDMYVYVDVGPFNAKSAAEARWAWANAPLKHGLNIWTAPPKQVRACFQPTLDERAWVCQG
jgi:hypothetical protein